MTILGEVSIPRSGLPISIQLETGKSIVLIGANGAGKTRLGIYIDQRLSQVGVDVHRVAAHRSLTLNPDVIPPSYEIATKRLHYGSESSNGHQKQIYRYGNKPETAQLNDFDHLLSALYAENNDVSIAFRQACLENPEARGTPPAAMVDRLKRIWDSVLPHRQLVLSSGNTKTRGLDGIEYSSSDMSDGERVVFYLIAQSLLAKPNMLLIFDEPELHINKSILAKLWDEIESVRSDCSFLYITHDVEFAASRHAATKFALRSYKKSPSEMWDIDIVPEGTELPNEVVSAIIGSRRPVLFVEGTNGSLDVALYRRVYNKFTIIPVGACDQVIHTVVSFSLRADLHHVGCAGIVDADGRDDQDAAHLESRGIYRLPVSEVENLLLLPDVYQAIAHELSFAPQDALTRLVQLKQFVFQQAESQINEISLRYTRRKIDSKIKSIGLSSSTIGELENELNNVMLSISPDAIFKEKKTGLEEAIKCGDYEKILLLYDNKGLLAEAARQLGLTQKALQEFIGRALRSDQLSRLHVALSTCLPIIIPRP